MTKRVIKGLGACKSDKAICRASAAAPPVSHITAHYQDLLDIHIKSKSSTKKSRSEDVQEVLKLLSSLKPFQHTPGRILKGFKLNSDPLQNMNREAFTSFLCDTSDRLKRSVRN